jgi:hypothetical protein
MYIEAQTKLKSLYDCDKATPTGVLLKVLSHLRVQNAKTHPLLVFYPSPDG